MKKIFGAILMASAVLPAMAQMSPFGLWRSIDDKSGEARAEIRISESSVGGLSGKIEKRLSKEAKAEDVCDECSDDRKGKPIQGLEILRGGKKAEGKDVWEGGKILDPENGRSYNSRLTPIDGGKRLEVRGSVGPFGRTQTWTRIN
jgi:uncharacterized protein (DUF2147 family)